MEHTPIDESLLLQYFSGSLSLKEKLAVEQWMTESDENRKLADDIHYIGFAIHTMDTIRKVDAPAALSVVKKRIKGKKKPSVFVWLQRLAALLFIPLLIGTVYYNGIKTEPVRYQEMHTQEGMIGSVELPDGTKVWLNSDSYLKYPVHFEKKQEREVFLNGEAYFSVTRDEKRPFRVRMGNAAKIEVLGTEFNVDAYADNNFVSTTLVEGSVRFFYMKEGKEENLLMLPNQKVVVDKQGASIHRNETFVPKDIAWKEGRIVLRDTPLTEVLWILSKRFNIDFVVTKESLKENYFTGIFENQDLVRILDHLKIASRINYRFDKSEITDSDETIKTRVVLY